MKMNDILRYLDILYPNPRCELDYHKDYELLIAVMLSAQTTDKRVNMVTKELFSKYDSLDKLAVANIDDIKNIIRSIGNYCKKANAIITISKTLLDKYNGLVPPKRSALEAMPMVGRKTTNVVLSEWFKIPNIAVDTHVERVSKRLGIAKEKDSVLDVESKLKKKVPKDRWSKMHLQLVMFGRYHCTALKPHCDMCELKKICKYQKKN